VTLPPLTPRGFWTRVITLRASLVAYLWANADQDQEHSLIGVALLRFLILLSLAELIVTVVRRPLRRPR
jgi:hypothetical protein